MIQTFRFLHPGDQHASPDAPRMRHLDRELGGSRLSLDASETRPIQRLLHPATLAVLLLASGGAARGDEPIPRPDDGPRDYRAKFAIIVGINDYQSHGQGLRDLQYAANDAREFRKLLVEEFGY